MFSARMLTVTLEGKPAAQVHYYCLHNRLAYSKEVTKCQKVSMGQCVWKKCIVLFTCTAKLELLLSVCVNVLLNNRGCQCVC